MIKVVVVDLDDTLMMTEAVCFRLENEVLQRMGRPPMSRAIHRATWGRSLWDAIIERSPGVDTTEFRRQFGPVIERYVQNGELDAISDSNYAALKVLNELGKQLLILTSRTHEEVSHLLTPDHRLASHILKFYYHDTMKFHKPDPRAFTELLIDWYIQPEEAVYVGDSPSDAAASKAAGLLFIANLEAGLRKRRDFAAHPVDKFIAKFPDVVDAVKQLETK